MYYKLLHKTILTSALVSLICAGTMQAKAQELVLDDDVDISLPKEMPAEATVTAKENADDIIPLDGGIIVPQTSSAIIQTGAQMADEALDDMIDENLDLESVSAPSTENLGDFAQNFDDVQVPEVTVNIEQPEPVAIQTPAQTAPLPQQEAALIPAANPAPAPIAQAQNAPQAQPFAIPAELQSAPVPSEIKQKNVGKTPNGLKFGDSVLIQSNNSLFNQMSDIEKQTTLLTLQLKRERIRNEIEAARAVREKAAMEKRAAEEARIREEEEWRKEQEAKVIREQVALKQKEIELEKLKQRKALAAYMNTMLEQKQSWIQENAKLYNEINELKKANHDVRQSYKKDLENISAETEKVFHTAETAKSSHDRIVESLTAQNEQLKKRIEAEIAARQRKNNPFGVEGGEVLSSSDELIKPISVAREYAIMEIIGKGDDLLVKLINKDGESFLAKKGTVLQTGHTIEDIAQNYVQFDRNGLKDFLYTAAAPLSAEPEKIDQETASENGKKQEKTPTAKKQDAPAASVKPRANLVGDEQVPSLGNSMFVK